MIPSTSPPNEPNKPHVSSNVVGVLCGMLVCFLLLTITFVWWRNLFQSLPELIRSLRERVATFFSRSPPQFFTRPAVNTPSITPLAPILTYPLRRQHGPDSVDTLPPYTPSEGLSPSSTEHAANAIV